MIRFLVILTSIVTLTVPSHAASEDPVSYTTGALFVRQTGATLRITCFAEDLIFFQDIASETDTELTADVLREAIKHHGDVMLERVILRDAAGERIGAKITDISSFQVPEDGIPIEKLMEYELTYQLEYQFDSPPEFLTLQHEFSDANYIMPSILKLVVRQEGTDVDFAEGLKAGDPVTLRFDWKNPPLSAAASEEEWEAWYKNEVQATLGLISYRDVYSFLYMEPMSVRHELLIPLSVLRTIIPIKQADEAFLEVDEQDAVRETIRKWVLKGNPVLLNGVPVEPEFARIDFISVDRRDMVNAAEPERVSAVSGRVGIIMVYQHNDEPVREAKITWDVFPSAMTKFKSIILPFQGEIESFEFSRHKDNNTLVWTPPVAAPLEGASAVKVTLPKKPVLSFSIVSLVCVVLAAIAAIVARRKKSRLPLIVAGALLAISVVSRPIARVEIDHPTKSPPDMPEKRAAEIVQTLQRGAYDSLALGSEKSIYDSLSRTVSGDLLEELYIILRQSLSNRETGGAVARVKNLSWQDGSLAENTTDTTWPAFNYRAVWNVSGTVEHWGHVHERTNQFAAVFHVEPIDGQWKITSMRIESEKQIGASRPVIRDFSNAKEREAIPPAAGAE